MAIVRYNLVKEILIRAKKGDQWLRPSEVSKVYGNNIKASLIAKCLYMAYAVGWVQRKEKIIEGKFFRIKNTNKIIPCKICKYQIKEEAELKEWVTLGHLYLELRKRRGTEKKYIIK